MTARRFGAGPSPLVIMVLLDKRPLQVRAVFNEANCAEWSAVDLIS
jgi:hypothetical protein